MSGKAFGVMLRSLDIIQQSKESLQGFSEEKWFIFINYF
jgi:hypothetical protein